MVTAHLLSDVDRLNEDPWPPAKKLTAVELQQFLDRDDHFCAVVLGGTNDGPRCSTVIWAKGQRLRDLTPTTE